MKALDRSRLLRDVSAALADHHVNIVACNTDHRLRPHLEDALRLRAGRPGHLDSVLRTIKQIDSVYDAYRVVPGKGG